jgi:hypothetical protein
MLIFGNVGGNRSAEHAGKFGLSICGQFVQCLVETGQTYGSTLIQVVIVGNVCNKVEKTGYSQTYFDRDRRIFRDAM